ncbi:hypothetical protein C4J81_15090 [Deltaproteobacteria bacterium Smac51]|nr:hypothetical protein C4J81_15090 [Deltaproteobacteria bacterium Smac51]
MLMIAGRPLSEMYVPSKFSGILALTALMLWHAAPAAAETGGSSMPKATAAVQASLYDLSDDGLHWLDGGLRVELRAPVMVMLSAPVGGRLTEVPVRDGDEVREGDLLAQVDDRLHLLRRDAAKGARDQAATQLKVVKKLHSLGSRGALDVQMAQAQFDSAEAEMKMAEEMVTLCRIQAPWNGRISQLEVKPFQHVAEGMPLLEISQEGPMEVEFMMPSAWIAVLRPGAVFSVQVDETGQTYSAEIDRLGGKVDPLTQSIRVYGHITGRADGLLPGMTGLVIMDEAESRS